MKRQPPLDVILLRARRELAINATITGYLFIDGAEKRYIPNGFAIIRTILADMANAFNQFRSTIQGELFKPLIELARKLGEKQ